MTATDDGLLTLFDEIWAKQSYLPGAWHKPFKPTVVDIGANVGVFAVWAARRLGAERILAVEPSLASVAQLRANLDRNGITGATVLQVAAGGREREATLYRRGVSSLSTLFPRDVYGSTFETETCVRVLTLDEIIAVGQIAHCDLLKIDCEGSEYETLFATSPGTLARIQHIVGEYHDGMTEYGATDLLEFLERAGYEITCFPPLDEEGGLFHASRKSRGTRA